MNNIFPPTISQLTGNLRKRIRCRIPLLVVFAPLTVLSLVGVGFAPKIGGWLPRGPSMRRNERPPRQFATKRSAPWREAIFFEDPTPG